MEQKPVEEQVETQPVEETRTEVERAEDAVKAMKAENDRAEAIAERMETARAKEILGGKAKAGQVPPEPVEVSDKEYAQKVLNGEMNGTEQ